MRITITLLLSFVCVVVFDVNSQNLQGVNLTYEQFNAISFGGQTLSSLKSSGGNKDYILTKFGANVEIKENNNINSETSFYYPGLKIVFSEGVLVNLEISTSSRLVTILGKSVRIGETLISLKQKFGNTIVPYDSPHTNGTSTIGFNVAQNDYDAFYIEIDNTTRKVISMVYFTNP